MPGHRINPFISSAPYVHHLEANLHNIFNVVCSFQGVEFSFHACMCTYRPYTYAKSNNSFLLKAKLGCMST